MFPYVPSEVRISTEIPPRGHIPALWERIEGEMMSRGAKFNTLCPIRAEEHRKLFDELIRQVLVQSPEQGALLWRVRMESEGSVDTWKELCVCGQNYGNRVYTKIDPNQQTEFIQRCREINGEIDSLERQLIALKARYNFAIRLRDEQIGVEGEELKESQFLETQKKQQFSDLINYMNNYHLDDSIEYTEENFPTFRKLKGAPFTVQDKKNCEKLSTSYVRKYGGAL
ncbi:uncharacterized protein LOC142344395 [Convolutriloba macropyga]|uniref:uncharacterized protein LOC142344395 n=1 Tax=Convolutriloba macropyga TaxID=536237 RepID=UPI003F520904